MKYNIKIIINRKKLKTRKKITKTQIIIDNNKIFHFIDISRKLGIISPL